MSTGLSALRDCSGFVAACLVDSETGIMLDSIGAGARIDIEAAGAAQADSLRAQSAALNALGLSESIRDVLVSLGTQVHLIRPLAANPSVFLYLALDREAADLGAARRAARQVEAGIALQA